jgi:alcohol dehydrogenase (cytochrome c)
MTDAISSRVIPFFSAGLIIGFVTAPLETGAQVEELTPVTDAMLADPDPADWLSWRRSIDGRGYSPLDEIDRDNVGNLQLAWSWGLEPGPSQTTPVVHDGVMYVASPGGVVHALDAATGDFVWEYRRPMEERLRAGQQMRSLAIYRDLVYLNTGDAHVIALDARTGDVRWDTPTTPEGVRRGFSSGPIVADGVVVAGHTYCGADGYACYIIGIDALTGEELWRVSTIALAGEPGGDTWGGIPVEDRAGAEAWVTGSYDAETGLVYWGTAQAKPWARSARGTEGGAELYTNSTLALEPRTGEIRWFHQHIPGESHDMDESFERILLEVDGRRSVLSMGKLGILWELDRVTGEFVRAIDLGYQSIVDIHPATGEVTYRPGMLSKVDEVIHFCPSTSGFKTFRAMAYAPETHALYIPLHLNCQTSSFNAGAGVSNRVNHFHPASPDQLGEFVALDLLTGERLWSVRRRSPFNTSALTTAGRLVFVGDWDRYVMAYDVSTGEQLWESRLPTMANGTPITYAAGGRQYVAFVAGPSIAQSSWATIIPPQLLPEIRHPPGGSGVYVFAVP